MLVLVRPFGNIISTGFEFVCRFNWETAVSRSRAFGGSHERNSCRSPGLSAVHFERIFREDWDL